MNDTDLDTLERLLSNSGLPYLLEGLAHVAIDKAAESRARFNQTAAELAWRRVARKLLKLVDSARKEYEILKETT